MALRDFGRIGLTCLVATYFPSQWPRSVSSTADVQDISVVDSGDRNLRASFSSGVSQLGIAPCQYGWSDSLVREANGYDSTGTADGTNQPMGLYHISPTCGDWNRACPRLSTVTETLLGRRSAPVPTHLYVPRGESHARTQVRENIWRLKGSTRRMVARHRPNTSMG